MLMAMPTATPTCQPVKNTRTACLLLTLLMSGCASTDGVSHSARNQFVTEFYAYVQHVQPVKFKSYVGEAAAIGAIDGFISNVHYNRDAMLGGALLGGLFAGVVTALFEGPNKGFEYQLAAIDGDDVTVIIDHQPAQTGDCVKVRVAGDVSVQAMPNSHCVEQMNSI